LQRENDAMTDRQGNTRRDFLRTSAAVGGALTGGLIVPGAYAAGNDVIKVGLVGCGGRGSGAAENICEAAGTSFNIKIHALADVFPERIKNVRERLSKAEGTKDKLDVTDERCFAGFDGYQKVIESCDLVMLATPPGFRPQHIEATIKAGKHLFTEKPVAVDGTGIRKVLAAAEEANKKNLRVVAGTQRRHQAGYLESMKRIHEGAIGDLVTARVYWNQGNIWAIKRQPEWSDTEYQVRNWYHFVWLCGDHIVEQHVHNLDVANWAIGSHPVRAVGMGGRQVNTAPEFGQSFDHFAVEYEYPNNVFVQSMCRQIAGCENNVSETLVGTKGQWASGGYRFSGAAGRERIRVREINPYVQEHIDLLTCITEGKPINELAQVAESTLTAIMGRMSAYTGKAVTWEQALNSKLDTFPKELSLDGKMEEPPVPVPGQTELI
jgi:predicted dehydrogenase